ncbi:hypothetical protein HK103_001021 [Boothiomyces macroporosus]|uniref:Antiviral helicase n=1 Tax=Boothiomyces macroporosus TaxID=261099 RepID=A0AAD5Y151_9FUNG|nr:hypothetical protein HK103_001021 [Boothiomyces macroporosus]
MEFINYLETLETQQEITELPLLRHSGTSGNMTLADDIKLNVGLGPLTLKNNLAEYLKPNKKNELKPRRWERETDLHSLIKPSAPSKNLLSLEMKRNFDGELDFANFKLNYLDNSQLNAKNSTSLQREPTKNSEFVRGKTTHYPFMPGGIALPQVLDNKDFNEDLFDELLQIAPGLDRGLNLEYSENSVDISALFAGQDFILQEEEEEIPIFQEKQEIIQEKDVDDLLPESDNLLTAKPQKKKQKEWAHMVDVNLDFPEFHDLVPEMAFTYPFELDVFQKRAVYHLEQSESVFVAAHTSAGKTVVAEYAIALAQKHMTRAIYTSPIKALSNQKYRDFKETFGDVGILTGDIQIKPEASCLVMTTEILRSMLYRGADLIRDVEFVIFDEVHYVNDSERGVVWEEVIIMLPAHVNLILLSATVPNTKEFADWVGRTKQKNIYVISTLKRPVPLEHHLFIDKEIYKIVDSNKNFIAKGYKDAYDIANPKKDKVDSSRGRGRGRGNTQVSRPTNSNSGGRNSNISTDKNVYINLISYLKKKNLLPVIVFAFSKKKCEEYAQALTNIDLSSNASEKSQIHVFIENSIACLKGNDKELPQILRMRDLLSRGIAVHHSGLLPILKEIVEILFTRGLVKVLFATETFAMGVNAPARSVVFAMIRKHDGQNFRQLLPGEYTQMSGRAGRRGLDATGMVIIACNDKVPDEIDLRQMILGKPTKLESQFRVTYNMILNLLRVEAIKVEDMIKRSFSENSTQKALPEHEQALLEGSKKLASLEKLDCTICNTDIEMFYDVSYRVLTLGYSMQEKIINSSVGMKALSQGRVVVINNQMYRNALAVILKVGTSNLVQTAETATRNINSNSLGKQSMSTRNEKTFWMFILTDVNDTNGAEVSALPVTTVSFPPISNLNYAIECLSYTTIAIVTPKQIKVDPESIVTLKKSSVIKETMLVMHDVGTELQNEGYSEYDWSKIRDIEFQEQYREKKYGIIHKERMLREQLQGLEQNLSEMNLELLPDYHQRIEVLKELGFIDHNSIVQIKGRVACEINTADELILTELILDNFLSDYEPAEIVALLSCFVFQEKSDSEPVLTPNLEKGVEDIKKLAIKIAQIQRACGINIHEEDVLDSLKFGLVEVVYEWARGLPFKQITELTDVLEGSIVRCIVRLSETCREVSGAARLVGDSGLYRKVEEAAELIRRDIVFAASLYF